MTLYEKFKQECDREIEEIGRDVDLISATRAWINRANEKKYSYHFEWLGRPIIQYPQDIVAMQELIWKVRPDLIIETGIAHGGSLIFSASILAQLELCEAIENGVVLDPAKPSRMVVGIDIDIREHNRAAIEAHPMGSRIRMLQGSSTDPGIVSQAKAIAAKHQRVLVCLDSNHTHEHVLGELQAYAPLVSIGSYCVVFDTIIEDLPEDSFPDRPWARGNNPKTAVHAYLRSNPGFSIDKSMDSKLLISVAPEGYLKRIE